LRQSLARIRELDLDDITQDNEKSIMRSISRNRVWCLEIIGCSDTGVRLKNFKALFRILEISRKYACTCVCMDSHLIAQKARQKHPWIDSGTYAEAVTDVDLLIVNGTFPDPKKYSDDHYMWESLISERLNGVNKPTVFLDKGFRNLAPVADYITNEAMLEKMGGGNE